MLKALKGWLPARLIEDAPQAPVVLRSLTAYLRAAVPLLREPAATIERELQLVRP